MQLYFVRHGEPGWVKDGRGVADPALTERGHAQAARLAERLRGAHFDQIWVSPALRAQQTAAPVLAALGREARVLDWLTELRLPDWDGWDEEHVAAFFEGSRFRPYAEWWSGMPGAESARDFVVRVCDGLDEELADLGGRCEPFDDHAIWHDLPAEHRVLVVCHAGTTGAALSHLLALPQVPWAWERFYLGHTGWAKVRTTAIAHGHLFGLTIFNDLEHLPQEMRSR